MRETEHEPAREPNFEKCVSRLSELLVQGTAERVGRQDVRILQTKGEDASHAAKLAVVDERTESERVVDRQFGLFQPDDLHDFIREDGSYPYIWQLLSVHRSKDELIFGLQEVRKDAKRKGLGSVALEALSTSAKEAHFSYLIAEPIDAEVGVWHMRHGAYVDYELESRPRKRFAEPESHAGVLVRFLNQAEATRDVQDRYQKMSLEDREAEYRRWSEGQQMLLSVSNALLQLAGRLDDGQMKLGDLATAQEVIDDLRTLAPELQEIPDDEAIAARVIKENTKLLDSLRERVIFTSANLKLFDNCIAALE